MPRKHRPDFFILLITILLFMIGLIIIFAIGPQRVNFLNNINGTNENPHYYFIHQLTSVGLSLVAFILAMKMPFAVVKKFATAILVTGFAACLILSVLGFAGSGLANCNGGACRWFDLGVASFQPSELLKLGLLIYLAAFIGNRVGDKSKNGLKDILTPTAIISVAALFFVVILQRDLGTGISIFCLIFSMFLVSGMSKKLLALVISAAVVAGVGAILLAPYRLQRVMTFFQGDTASIEDDDEYHATQAKIAIGSGGLLGVGIGNSVQATGYLPESINDSIFAILGETFGFIGLLVIVALFTILLYRILRVSYYLHDPASRLLVAGVFGWLSAHVIMNIAGMTGIMPLKGITLPLLSYGGTSMVFISVALGLVFQLSSYTSHTPKEENEDTHGRRGIGRSRYASLGRHHRS